MSKYSHPIDSKSHLIDELSLIGVLSVNLDITAGSPFCIRLADGAK